MKGNIALALLTSGMLAAGVAQADSSVKIPLSGTVAKSCSVTAFLNGPFDALDMTSTELQGAESLSPVCNYGGTLNVTFASANGGKMLNGTNEVPYTLTVSGGLLNAASLGSPVTVGNWPAVANAVQTRSMSVKLGTATLVAGTYTDTITASVTPN